MTPVDSAHLAPKSFATRRIAEWWALAFSRRVALRGAQYAVVVGALLVAINHGSAILSGDVDSGRVIRIGLTVLVPYCVSVLSSVGAIKQLKDSNGAPPTRMAAKSD